MGLYPPRNPAEIETTEMNEKHIPPMKIRSRTLRAVIDGYTLVPVYSYIPAASGDALGPGSCYYVSQCIDNRYSDPTQYVAETEYYLPAIGYRVAKAFKWTEAQIAKMTYINFQQLSDVLVAEKFQGLPPRAIFSEEDWYMIRNS
jgi:hypothetical protein